MPKFTDIHSHIVPSGDDGVSSEAEGLELIKLAAERGTSVLYATPHVWPIDGLKKGREESIKIAYERMRPQALKLKVDLRLGFEVTPAPARYDEDPFRYRLGDLNAVLIEVPFRGPLDLSLKYAEFVEGMGLLPILAHPERSDAILNNPSDIAVFQERGWLIQINSSSLLGKHGRAEKNLAWKLVQKGFANLVASDGHRALRPPYLDGVYQALVREIGPSGESLVDGSALKRISQAEII